MVALVNSGSDVKVQVSLDKKTHEWQGNRVGEGRITISQEIENSDIFCDLEFIKPLRSKAKLKFAVIPYDQGATIKWHMVTQLPFFLLKYPS